MAEPEPRTGIPMILEEKPHAAALPALGGTLRPRDGMLRMTLFATLLGAVLTVIYSWVLGRQQALAGTAQPGFASFHQVLVPLLAVVAVAGALLLERATPMGMVLLLVGTGLGLAGGAVWLVPGTVLGCVWSAHHDRTARAVLGFLLLVPGVAGGYFGLVGSLSFAAGIEASGFPLSLGTPLSLGQALAPLELLPLAWLGAWLLVSLPVRSD